MITRAYWLAEAFSFRGQKWDILYPIRDREYNTTNKTCQGRQNRGGAGGWATPPILDLCMWMLHMDNRLLRSLSRQPPPPLRLATLVSQLLSLVGAYVQDRSGMGLGQLSLFHPGWRLTQSPCTLFQGQCPPSVELHYPPVGTAELLSHLRTVPWPSRTLPSRLHVDESETMWLALGSL